jgi:NAD(P)-dependent dehydrogenase (short-subunit alcohol dehydrogenase family)
MDKNGPVEHRSIEGAYFIVRAFFEDMVLSRKKGRPKIVLFSGGGAAKPRPNFSAYGAAKTALVRLTEPLAKEWANLPVDINIVAPGAINTAMTREVVDIGPEKAGEIEFKRAVQQLHQGR